MNKLSLVLIGGDERCAQIKSWLCDRHDITLAAEFRDSSGLRLLSHLISPCRIRARVLR